MGHWWRGGFRYPAVGSRWWVIEEPPGERERERDRRWLGVETWWTGKVRLGTRGWTFSRDGGETKGDTRSHTKHATQNRAGLLVKPGSWVEGKKSSPNRTSHVSGNQMRLSKGDAQVTQLTRILSAMQTRTKQIVFL